MRSTYSWTVVTDLC